jgi:hypothetical protein
VEICPDDSEPTRSTLSVDTILQGRYLLGRRVGQGSVSVVYTAQNLVLGTKDAVKIILPELVGSDRTLSEAFLREATAAAAIRHPNVVGVIDSGLLNEIVPFIVMEFVSGPSLQELLSGDVLTPVEALEYISIIGAGLAAAHRLNIVHGDLKPRNILIAEERPLAEAIKILDFGMSRMKSGKLTELLAAPKGGGMLRSPLYLAPEEWSDGETDHRSDIYSLGIILYQMLSGAVPFKGKSTPAIMKQHLLNPPPPIITPTGALSSEVEAVVLHALQKNPDQRPASVDEFVLALRAAVGSDEAPAAVRPRRTVPKKARGLVTRAPEKKEVIDVGGTKILTETGAVVDHAVGPRISEAATAAFGQTIVISSPRHDDTELEAAGYVESPPAEANFDQTVVLKAEPIWDQTVVLPANQSAFDQTLLGVSGEVPEVPSVDTLVETTELISSLENAELVPEGLGPDDEGEEPDETAFSIASDEPEKLPRTLAPLLLAAGVLLVVLLIAVGVYYSHVSQ